MPREYRHCSSSSSIQILVKPRGARNKKKKKEKTNQINRKQTQTNGHFPKEKRKKKEKKYLDPVKGSHGINRSSYFTIIPPPKNKPIAASELRIGIHASPDHRGLGHQSQPGVVLVSRLASRPCKHRCSRLTSESLRITPGNRSPHPANTLRLPPPNNPLVDRSSV